MTQIKKIKDKQGNDIYLRTHTKAVVDDNGYTAESRLQAMQDEINQAQLAVGAVPSDLTPTKDSTNWVTSGGMYNVLPKKTVTLFENTASTVWSTGNLDTASIGTYANKYVLLEIPEGVSKLKVKKGASNFNLSFRVSNSNTSGFTGTTPPKIGTEGGEELVDVSGYRFFGLQLWDRPTDAQAKAESITVTYTELAEISTISKDFFDTIDTNVASMSLVSPMATDLYIEKLTTDNGGIVWEQGGINGNTGADESNTGAIRTLPIYFNGDLNAQVNIGSLDRNGRIAVFDGNGGFKSFVPSLSQVDYPDGYIKFVFYGSTAILPERGVESGAYVIRHKKIAQRLENIESKVGAIYNNPVLRIDFADPTIWDGEDGYFYALATGEVTTRTMYRSANLVNWEDTGELPYSNDVAQTILSNLGNYTRYWAPCVYKVKEGQWNMYLTKPSGGIAFLTSKYPTYGYEFVKFTTAPFSDYIDPDVVRERDGKLWMFAGSAGMMHRRQMTDDGLDFAEGSEWIHVAGRPSGESGNTNRIKTFEGEYLYRHKGYWYLFCSSGQYNNSTYAIRVVRSATLDGEFVDKEGNLATEGYAETIMSSNGTLYGPGHNAQIFVDSSGKTWMLYHSHWTGMSSSAARPMCLDEVLWDEDGWPYFNGGTPSLSHVAPSVIR